MWTTPVNFLLANTQFLHTGKHPIWPSAASKLASTDKHYRRATAARNGLIMTKNDATEQDKLCLFTLPIEGDLKGYFSGRSTLTRQTPPS